jgi:hypothetical protein
VFSALSRIVGDFSGFLLKKFGPGLAFDFGQVND